MLILNARQTVHASHLNACVYAAGGGRKVAAAIMSSYFTSECIFVFQLFTRVLGKSTKEPCNFSILQGTYEEEF